jgi:hypothetical protein
VNFQEFHPFLTGTKYQFYHPTTPKPYRNVNLLLYKIKVSNHKTHKNLLTLLTLNTLLTLIISRPLNNPHMGFRKGFTRGALLENWWLIYFWNRDGKGRVRRPILFQNSCQYELPP